MGHARYIGRVGALAVTLGVGAAMACAPGIAYADPSDGASTSAGDSSSSSSKSKSKSSSTTKSSAGSGSSASDGKSKSASADVPTAKGGDATDDDATDDVQAGQDAVAEELTPSVDEADVPPAVADGGTVIAVDEHEASPADPAQARGGDLEVQNSTRANTFAQPDDSDDVDQPLQNVSLGPVAKATAEQSFVPSAAVAFTPSATTLAAAAPAVAPQRQTLVGVVTDFLTAVLQPILSPVDGVPIQMPILTAVLSLVRNEFERIFAPRAANAASQQAVTSLTDPTNQPSALVDPTQQHVLVIGVDGTNLSRILADDYNQNFFELMDTGTTAASSIVGHTTVSNPSWTAILTGVWGERTGVINNVFTPWTYDTWPTVFNQLETLDPDIETMTVADWDVINAISGAGSIPVDTNTYVAQVEGDTNWLETDDAVADATVAAILGADAPNFLFSYYVGVDENGHLYGGDSPEYAAAIRNMDDNLGEILDAVNASGEQWTIIVVTDHGHQPQKGFGHGFQSPDETSTFVIANGGAFEQGFVNLQYEIVDTTPTVVSLFGGTPLVDSDGVPLTTLGTSDADPVDLKQALEDVIAMNGYPDGITNAALALRTIFATVPYYVYGFGNDVVAGVPSFLVVPVKIVFDGLYVVTNVPAQVVAMLTGVTGASIFPLLPPPPPMFPPAEEATLVDAAAVSCGGAPGSPAAERCGERIVA